MSKTMVDKILDEKFPKGKDEENDIEIFEADKKIRFASKFVQLMRLKIDIDEEKRLFNELREQKKEQKLKYEEAEQKKKKNEEKEKKNKKKKRSKKRKKRSKKNKTIKRN